MSDTTLDRLRKATPYEAPSAVAARCLAAALTVFAGCAGILTALVAFAIHAHSYGQAVHQADQVLLPCQYGIQWQCPTPVHIDFWRMVSSDPGWYLGAVIGAALLVVGIMQWKHYVVLDDAAQQAHDVRLLDKHEARLVELRSEPFTLLYRRFGWWMDGTVVVTGVEIEFQSMQGGPRKTMTIPIHRVGYLQSQDAAENVFFPERESEGELGVAVNLMLPRRPWWLRRRLARFL